MRRCTSCNWRIETCDGNCRDWATQPRLSRDSRRSREERGRGDATPGKSTDARRASLPLQTGRLRFTPALPSAAPRGAVKRAERNTKGGRSVDCRRDAREKHRRASGQPAAPDGPATVHPRATLGCASGLFNRDSRRQPRGARTWRRDAREKH